MAVVTVIHIVTDVTAINRSRAAQPPRSGVSQQQGSVEAEEEGRFRSLMMMGGLCRQVQEVKEH